MCSIHNVLCSELMPWIIFVTIYIMPMDSRTIECLLPGSDGWVPSCEADASVWPSGEKTPAWTESQSPGMCHVMEEPVNHTRLGRVLEYIYNAAEREVKDIVKAVLWKIASRMLYLYSWCDVADAAFTVYHDSWVQMLWVIVGELTCEMIHWCGVPDKWLMPNNLVMRNSRNPKCQRAS